MRTQELILSIQGWLEKLDPMAMQHINAQLEDFDHAKPKIAELKPYDNNDFSKLKFLKEMRACFQKELFPNTDDLNFLYNYVNDQLIKHQEINDLKHSILADIRATLSVYTRNLPNIAEDLKTNIKGLVEKETQDPSSKLKPLVILYCYSYLAHIYENIYYVLPNVAVELVTKLCEIVDNLTKSTTPANDTKHLSDMEKFAVISWDLYRLEELRIAVAHGLRLPNHKWFKNQINHPELTEDGSLIIATMTNTPIKLALALPTQQLAPIVTPEIKPINNLVVTPQPMAATDASKITPALVNTKLVEAVPEQHNDSEQNINEAPVVADTIITTNPNTTIDSAAKSATSPIIINNESINSASSVNAPLQDSRSSTPNIDTEELELKKEKIDLTLRQQQFKSRTPQITKPFPAVTLKPKTEEQILFGGFNETIQKLDIEKFNTLLTTANFNPSLATSLVKLLTTKINERHKNPGKLYDFIDQIDLPFEIFSELFQSEQINHDRLDKLVKRLCQYPVECFFDEKILKNPKIIRKETLQLFTNRIASNKRWLEAQIGAYLNFLAKHPTEFEAAKTTWPISTSKFFKEALQMLPVANNPLFIKILESANITEITAEQIRLTTALQQLAREQGLILASKDYKNSIFARCEATNNLALLKLFIAMFRAEFDAVIANDKEIIHTWVSESTDEYFDTLIESLTPEQLASRINQPNLLQEASPLARALYLHNILNPKTNMLSTLKHKISVLLKHGAKEEILIKKANKDHITIINSALSKGFPEIVLMFLSHPEAIRNNITTDGYSLLHYWALYAQDNFEIFEKLYDPNNNADLKLKGQQNLQQATFLHTLLSNTAASETECLKVLTRVFDGYVASHALGNSLEPKILTYLETLLLTQNEYGISLLSLAETRNWKVIQTYLMKYIEILFINLVEHPMLTNKQEIVKTKLSMLIDILKYMLLQPTYPQLFEAGEYENLLECIDVRTKFRQDICKAIGAPEYGYDLLNGNTHEFISKEANKKVLFYKVFDAKFDDNPLVEKLRQHTSVKTLIKYVHVPSMDAWKEIIHDLKHKTFEEVKPKLEYFAAMIKKYGFNIRYVNDTETDVIDAIIAADNVELSKFMHDSFSMTISSSDVIKCIRAKSDNFGANRRYLIELHFEHIKANPLAVQDIVASFFTDKSGTNFSILEYAILIKVDIKILDFIIKCLEQLDTNKTELHKKDSFSDQIFSYILSLAGVLPYSYCYDVLELLITKPEFKAKLLHTNKATGENCIAAFFSNRKIDTNKAHLEKIMQLLFDNGCDIAHTDKSKQNVFHYAAHFDADPEFMRFLKGEVIKRHSEQKLHEMLAQVSEFNKLPVDICKDNLANILGKTNEGPSLASIAFNKQATLTTMFNANTGESANATSDKQQPKTGRAGASKATHTIF